jgi:CheY-like chemotaxis protein
MNVLIVDDNPANRNVLRQMVSHCGYDPTESEDGNSAVNMVKQHDIDIILMDIMMPGMNGYEATSAIKKLAGENHIPVIFVTALHGEEALTKALESGGDDYISKPVNFDILQSKLRAHSRIRELTKQLLEKNNELTNHNRRLQHEHDLISYFFDNALARSYLDKRCIHHHFSPLAAFNGDIMLSRRSPSGGLYLLLGDFTGHGLTAAMGTLPVAQCFFDLTQDGLSIGDIARTINKTLNKLLPDELFLAASIVEINASGLQLEIWNGGMPSAAIVHKSSQPVTPLPSQHMPLGILKDEEFEAKTRQYTLTADDRLILYTDGIIETKNPTGEEFGEHRLQSLFSESGDRLFETIHKELDHFRKNSDQQDDISLVEILCDKIPRLDDTSHTGTSVDNELPWSISTTLNAKQIRHINPIPNLVDALDSALDLGNHKGLVYTLLSEVYNNALNHSILGLFGNGAISDENLHQYYNLREQALNEMRDAYITFDIEFMPKESGGCLKIKVEDSGNNAPTYSVDTKLEERKSDSMESLHGRGLLILSELCESIHIDNQAHRIELHYRLD